MTDDDGFERFCAEVRPRLVGALALHCGDRLVAEELAQDALVRAWERWPQVRAARDPAAWTYRVAFNLSASAFRRRGAERRARDRTREADPAIADHAQAVAVRVAVAQLSPRRRTALLLRHYLDLPIAEVAVAMSCSPGTVKALCAQAAAILREDPRLADVEVAPHA